MLVNECAGNLLLMEDDMEAKHTPGPWWIDDDGFIASGYGDNYRTVADPHADSLDIEEKEARAAIAKARGGVE